jgi:hypothetical protein
MGRDFAVRIYTMLDVCEWNFLRPVMSTPEQMCWVC